MAALALLHTTAQSTSEDKVAGFEQLADKVLSETIPYRQLLSNYNQIIGADASLIQGLAIRGDNINEGDSIPISSQRSRWQNFKPILSNTPPTNLQGTIYNNVRFGYMKGQLFSRIGGIPWIAVSSSGQVTHVGLPSDAEKANKLLSIVKEHIFGFDVDRKFENRLEYIYSKLFKELNQPFSASRKKLEDFLGARKHDSSWEAKGGFGYYSPKLFNVERFKKKYNVTDDELYRAGIMEVSISKEGVVNYAKRKDECVLIPFKREKFNFLGIKSYAICNWRMRVINPKKGTAKYLSHPFIRSFKSTPTVEQEMYNSHLLSNAKGKDIFFTEGEFKCHVATQKSGFLTVGIPGITMVTDVMLDKLIDSQAKSITIALDADTRAKSAKRADGVTDSERAAYEIAWRYKRRVEERRALGTLKSNTPELKIGLLTVTEDGDKQGLDDWLLPMTNHQAKKSMEHLRDSAMTPSEYATKIGFEGYGLNEKLAQLKIIKTETRAAVRSIKNTITRLFGSYSESDIASNSKLAALVELHDSLQTVLTTAESTQVKGLWALYNRGRLNLPGRKYRFLPSKKIPRAEKKAIYCPKLKQNLIDQAQGDIISTEVYFSDMPEVEKSPDALGESLPYSMQETLAYFCGLSFNEQIYQDYSRGLKALEITTDESETFKELQRTKDLTQFANILSAGFLSRAFTLDEYRFSSQLPCINRSDRFIEEFTKIELAIFSSKWNQLEMTITPVVWAPTVANLTDVINMQSCPHRFEVLPAQAISDIKRNTPSNPQRASMVAGAKGTRIRSFLRDPVLDLQRYKFKRIVTYLVDDDVGRARAKEHWAKYGLSAAAVDQARLSILTPEDLKRLQKILNKKKLLNQAMLSGIFRMTPEGKIAPAFKGDIQIMPSQTPTSLSIRVGVTPRDFDNKRIEPSQKVFYALRGARATAPQMDPSGHLFMGANLARAKNKTVVLCYNEQDAVLLNDYLPKSKFVVCSLNSDFTPRASVISQIKKSNCKNLVVIGKPNSERRYEGLLVHENIPIELPEILDLERRFSTERSGERAVQLSWAPLKSNLSEWIKTQLSTESDVSVDELKLQITAQLTDLVSYHVRQPSEVAVPIYNLKPSEFAAIAKLARARESYEHCIESVGVSDSSDLAKFNKVIKDLDRAISVVAKNYQNKNIIFPDNLSAFLKHCYPWVKFELPINEEDFIVFKEQHALGLPLRRIYRGIDTGSTSNKRFNSEVEVVSELLDESWNNSAMIDALQKEARAAKQTDYKRRLQEMLAIAIKHNKAIPTDGDLNKSQYKVKIYQLNRSFTGYTKDRARASLNHAVSATKDSLPGLVAAEVYLTIPGKDGAAPEAVSFYGQGASKDAAQQLAAKYACIYLGSIKLTEKQKVKHLWTLTYDSERRKKLAIQKKKQKEIRKISLEIGKRVKFNNGIDGSIGYGFRVKQ